MKYISSFLFVLLVILNPCLSGQESGAGGWAGAGSGAAWSAWRCSTGRCAAPALASALPLKKRRADHGFVGSRCCRSGTSSAAAAAAGVGGGREGSGQVATSTETKREFKVDFHLDSDVFEEHVITIIDNNVGKKTLEAIRKER